MSILLKLEHKTKYNYDRSIELGPQIIRLKPAPHCRAKIHSYNLNISPKKHFLNWQQDPFGNYLARAVFPEKVNSLEVVVDLTVEHRVFNPFDFFLEDYAKSYPFEYDFELKKELAPYLEITEKCEHLLQFVREAQKIQNDSILDFLIEVNKILNQRTSYLIRLEPGVQTCEETLRKQSGSCRDMTWVLCQALRHLGLATRFCSGYLIQLKPDIKSIDGPIGAAEDFTDLHAWTEVYLPGAGWVGFDPTSGLLAGEGHIPLCCTPNPSSAAPITGSLEVCQSTLDHTMTLTRLSEDRRITKPFSDTEWQDINELGNCVDLDLKKNDVRLTMGGEPTFVASDARDAEEWQLAALGKDKKDRATKLLRQLQEKFAPGGMLQFGQGKWYPGEILPRWSFNCYWRKDLQKIWDDKNIFADVNIKSNYNNEDAYTFINLLTTYLKLPKKSVIPAREDSAFYLWKESKLPCEGDIYSANLFEEKERDRLIKLMNTGLQDPVGYVLPLAYSYKKDKWISNLWKFKHNNLILTPGDSAIGFRLPLGSLPFIEESEEDINFERSHFSKQESLPQYSELKNNILERISKNEHTSYNDYLENEPSGKLKTSLCVEARDGHLHVFLPPLKTIEQFLDLTCTIELVATELNLKLVIEGYSPPHDLRIECFKLTPDPGVIEVNIHPSDNWNEIVENTETIYHEARKLNLVAEKFLIDGQRVGTGGGNHIVVGGKTPGDSPFLRRPDLLKSLITFWQNHPSLSYLFSSLFIGPTSQAPRIDEARNDALYELEIAFNQLSKIKDKENPYWLIDRLLRNILVDTTGNTHRAEFCIDKLFSPDGETGRLGLVELRNFEMPPHPKMSVVQNLLIRAIISEFWKSPYQSSLISWGTQLHDKFMLPYYLFSDFQDMLKRIESYSLKSEWFEPSFEFRFPLIGKTSVLGIDIELRNALEPWNVLGEESNLGSVSRSVDSSVQRMQVKISGDLKEHHLVTCNLYPLPLNETDIRGTYIAGVRYKAWAPYSSLHPTIPVHSPLVFDVIDKRHMKSIGGCIFHTIHPGGRSFDTLPINENEAEGRRLARFEEKGHTPGDLKPHQILKNRDFPHTLDLRLY